MKQKFLIGTMLISLCFTAQNANAQLEVQTSGNVQIVNKLSVTPSAFNNSDTAVSVVSTAAFTKSNYGVYSKAWYQKNPAGSGSVYNFANRVFGIYGITVDNLASSGQYTPTPPLNAGVAGSSDKGAGIFGTVGENFPSFNVGQYAGYFMGNTKVAGTLTCTSLTQTSDAITKSGVKYLQEDARKSLMQLKPISFYYNLDERIFNPEDAKTPAVQQMHYGFIAQELKEVLPDIVYMGQDSLLSVNYIELIPLLVKTVQELSEKVDELQNK
ncbi:MAG: tail fiber domain-containing protein [Paludibacteraceae bacterium]|nr:tail fiber domain-containing protein [Paludibacteraceae bacterium]